MRADELLVLRGMAESRSKARAIIEERKLICDGKIVDKPSRKLDENSKLEIAADAAALKYVSRAGLKLEGFLKKFPVNLCGAHILDAGASTGGFTDCALSFGAASACFVDVGRGQLHEKIASNPRVKNMEKTDVRSLSPETFDGNLFDFICADLSFISLEKVFDKLWSLLKCGGQIVCLVKPQFESSPEQMRKSGGIIKDEKLRLAALEKIKTYVSNFSDAEPIGEMESPISGQDGNVEFLIGFLKNPGGKK